MAKEQTGKIFYGWWLVAVLFLILFNTGGTGYYVFPVFIVPLQEEFGWSMTQISIGAAIWALVLGFSNPVIGILVSRFGVRKMILSAAMISSLTLLGFAFMQSLWMLYAAMVVSGFVVAGTTNVPVQTVVTHWFNKYRGRAMALTMLGIGAGGFLLPPFNEFLIRQWGWRWTWGFACVVLWVLVIPLMAIFVRNHPSDMGLQPDGASPGDEAGGGATPVSGLTVKRTATTLSFWLLVVIFVLQLMGTSALNFHFVPFAIEEANFTSRQAAFFYGLAVGFSIAGRLGFGWLADRWKSYLALALAGLFLACGPAVVWLFIIRLGLREVNLLWLYSAPFGIGIGGNAVIIPIVVGRCFGELNFPKIMGLVMSGFALGIIVGIPVTGYVFDTTGSYELAFILCFIGLVISAGLSLLVRPERYQEEFVTGEAQTT